MKHIKSITLSDFKLRSTLLASITLSLLLLLVRMKLNQSYFLLFLIWNLILAVIPFAITRYLTSIQPLKKWRLVFYGSIWLVFLPNAPYIITDLMHLRSSSEPFMWLDVLVITSFAINGLTLFFLSVMNMESILKPFLSDTNRFACTFIVMFLTGLGMYLGRYLRYNSWEIIQNPLELITDILDILMNPALHSQAWVFTLTFGAFLNVGFWTFKSFRLDA